MKKIAILVSLLISFIPLLFISAFFFKELKSVSEDTIRQTIQRELDIGSQNLSDLLKERFGNLQEWSMSPAFQVAFEFSRPEGLKTHLNFLKEQYEVYDWISVLTPKFKPFASSNLEALDSGLPKQIEGVVAKDETGFFISNGNLFVVNKIRKIESRKLLGFLIAKISALKFSMFKTQIIEHLDRYHFKSLVVRYQIEPFQIIEPAQNSSSGALAKDKVEICSSPNDNFLTLRICAALDRTELAAGFLKLRWSIISITLLLILLTFAVLNGVFGKILEPFYKILDSLSEVGQERYSKLQLNSSIKELSVIESKYNELIDNLKIEVEKSKLHSKNRALYEVSRQVSHDIRSPLAALNMIIGTLSQVTEEQRVTLRYVSNRISDIANHLLNTQKKEVSKPETQTGSGSLHSNRGTVELLSAIIDMIVSEKRIQFREKHLIEIDSHLEGAYGLFARVDTVELKRAISNLVNNSVEAMINSTGKIVVSLLAQGEVCEICISDNGRGMPKAILESLGPQGVSFGKGVEQRESGSGLGIFHAKKTIEELGGSLEILSEEGVGTLVKLRLPRVSAPRWFVETIFIYAKAIVVSVDDDISIHQIWNRRLEVFRSRHPELRQKTFTSGIELRNWLKSTEFSELSKDSYILFLMDYELLKQDMTGLDLIENLGIEDRSILVTSRYEDADIRERCMSLGVKLLPKALAEFVPFKFGEKSVLPVESTKSDSHSDSIYHSLLKPEEFEVLDSNYDRNLVGDDKDLTNRSPVPNSTSKSISLKKIRYDLCLIDDDQELIGVVWATMAAQKGMKIGLFATPQEFLVESDRIDRQTPIYIDVSLGKDVSGIDLAVKLDRLGFTNLHLATGFEATALTVPSFVRSVVGKSFPL